MAEPQIFPSTNVAGVATLTQGVELEGVDVALLGQVAGLADDRVIAELLRLMPTDGINPVARAILPGGYQLSPQMQLVPSATTVLPTVTPSGLANASVVIAPFRAVIGSRTPVATSGIQNWRDDRSAVFVGGAASLTQSIVLAPNASGNPRWDLIYVAVSVDVQANAVQRRVKAPGLTSAITPTTVFQYLAAAAAIQTVTGAPGASPVIPNVPGDGSGIWNIPLAVVLVPNGFGAASIVVQESVRDVAPVVTLSAQATGAIGARPASESHDTLQTSGGAMVITPGASMADPAFQWTLAPIHRPPTFLPPQMIGGESIFVDIDIINSAHPSHVSGAIIDRSVDWRKRFFLVFVSGALAAVKFSNDPTAQASAAALPTLKEVVTDAGSQSWTDFRMGNSFVVDARSTTTDSTIYYADNASTGGVVAGGTKLAIYVSKMDGTMRCWFSSSPAVRLFAWIFALPPMPNNTVALP
jgi:hypothetical protein